MTFEVHFGDLLTVVTLCSQLTRDLSDVAKFLVPQYNTVTDKATELQANKFQVTSEQITNTGHTRTHRSLQCMLCLLRTAALF